MHTHFDGKLFLQNLRYKNSINKIFYVKQFLINVKSLICQRILKCEKIREIFHRKENFKKNTIIPKGQFQKDKDAIHILLVESVDIRNFLLGQRYSN